MSRPLAERLSAQDVPRNVALSNAVGWPDDEAEWQVLHSAGRVLGVKRAGELVGQGVLGSFGNSGTIAKMVVAPDARGQGIGGAILDALLAEAEQQRLEVVSLVATPLGQPLYEKRGFRSIGEVVIVMGTPLLEAPAQLPATLDPARIVELEARLLGAARVEMLRGRSSHASAFALSDAGFALATAHARGARIGPLLASDDDTARALATAIFGSIRGPVRLDVPAERGAFRSFLGSLGLTEKGVHVEMTRGSGAVPFWCSSRRYGLATQAWG